MSADKSALDWLLQDEQPSMKYLALRSLLDAQEGDASVEAARRLIPKKGWAAEILSRQHPEGWWVSPESLYRPKYVSTNWMLLVLSDLGLTRADPRIERACALWIERFAKEDGGFGADGMKTSHLCITGNTARALVRFGYTDHPKVESAFEWLVKNQAPKGGWSCFGGGRNLDSWEGMSAFAVYPRRKWTKGMKQAVENGAEFYLERELHKQGARYAPWYRFHYPVHYFYDLLVGLDFMTGLGYGDDRRLVYALTLLREKRRKDGLWNLDAIHPDSEGAMAVWYGKRPHTPSALEPAGEPSKVITLRAMQVLHRLD